MPATNGKAMRDKGSAFERAVVEVLRANGHPYAERAYGAGRADDRGDIDGFPGATIEVRCRHELRPAVWWRSVVKKAERNRTFPVLIVKLPGVPAAGALVITPTDYQRLDMWARFQVRADADHL